MCFRIPFYNLWKQTASCYCNSLLHKLISSLQNFGNTFVVYLHSKGRKCAAESYVCWLYKVSRSNSRLIVSPVITESKVAHENIN